MLKISVFIGVNAAYAAWQDLGDRLEKHKAVMARLLEDAKVNLRHRAIALRDEKERWQAKWSSRSDVTLDWLVLMKERLFNLNGQMDSLKTDCERIALDLNNIVEDDEINLSNFERELEIEESNYRFLDFIIITLICYICMYIHLLCLIFFFKNNKFFE